MFFVTLGLLLALAGVIYLFLTWNFDYWKKRGVVGPPPAPFVGNYPSVFTQKRHMAYDIDDSYRAFKSSSDFTGIFSGRSPQLLITSPDLVQRVLVNDFKHFHDNEISGMVDENSDFIFSKNPFVLVGQEWKDHRAAITPGLTLGRVKTVFPVTTKICKVMTDYIRNHIRIPPKDGLNAKEISLRFTSQVVTDCVLGLNAESFSERPTPILENIKILFNPSFSLIFYFIVIALFPAIKSIYKMRFLPKKVEEFFIDLMNNAIKSRRSSKDHSNRTDFMNYLLQLQDKKNLSIMELSSYTMTFLLDGFETTAEVLSHTLLLLARYPETQARLYAEIVENLGKSEDIDFDRMIDLPYLDACIHETVRLFPPAFFSNKLCTEPIELENRNGQTLKLNKGDVVVLPFYSIMNDEEHYHEAHVFQPERFLEENGGLKKYRDMGVYYGFGGGPRICLGMRFALVQMKAALVTIIREFHIRVNAKTRNDNYLDPKYFLSRLDGGIWIDYEQRE